MKRLIGLFALLVFCASSVFSQDLDSLNAGDRPFLDTEPVDSCLLQSQLNLELGKALRDLGVELTFDERIVRAADDVLRHPEGPDSVDADGYVMRWERVAAYRQGYPCEFVMRADISSKPNCGMVRHFDDKDTYASVASRYVARMMQNDSALIKRSGFTGYGVGMMITEKYPELIDGTILTDEPTYPWISVLFFITL
jgi:hypothetical protein